MAKKMIIVLFAYSLFGIIITRASETIKQPCIEVFKIQLRNNCIDSICTITTQGQMLLNDSQINQSSFTRTRVQEPVNGTVNISQCSESNNKLLAFSHESLKQDFLKQIEDDVKASGLEKIVRTQIKASNSEGGSFEVQHDYSIVIIKDLYPKAGKVRFFSREIPDLEEKISNFLNKKYQASSKLSNKGSLGPKPVVGFALVIAALSVLGTIVYFKSADAPLPYILQLPVAMVMKIVPVSVLSAIKIRFGTQNNVYFS